MRAHDLLAPCLAALLLAACAANTGAQRTDAGGPDAGTDAFVAECERDLDCGDGILCTVDHCEDGRCVNDPCLDCCPAGEICVPDRGCGPPVQPCDVDADCRDDVPCTLDRCVDGARCEHAPQDGLCDSPLVCLIGVGCSDPPPDECTTDEDCGSFCSGEWSCQGELGCQFLGPTDCDDGDACTTDRCDAEAGACAHDPRDDDGDGSASLLCDGDDCDDGDPARHPSATERCDGADDDCDGRIDEGFECRVGASESCTSECGSTGTRTCTASCAWDDCAPPAEACGNGADDDCDDRIDEGCFTGTCGAAGMHSNGMLGALNVPAGASWELSTDTGRISDGATTILAASLAAPPSASSTSPGVTVVTQSGPYPEPPPQLAVFHFTSITIGAGATLRVRGGRAVALLATGAVTLSGTLDARGGNGSAGSTNSSGAAGAAGPGGFRGGGFLSGMGCPAGNGTGQGPGRGSVGECGGGAARAADGDGGGGGGGGGAGGCGAGGGAGASFGAAGSMGGSGTSGVDGMDGLAGTIAAGGGARGTACGVAAIGGTSAGPHGTPDLEPLWGGSGGGAGGFGGLGGFAGIGGNGGGLPGTPGFGGGSGGGGGGGGAVLVCSGEAIVLTGEIDVHGGGGGPGGFGGTGTMGSAPISSLSGARGGGGGAGGGGSGGGGGGGSGGAIVLEAPRVEHRGALDAGGGAGLSGGGSSLSGSGGSGRNGGGQGGRAGAGGAGGAGRSGGRGRVLVRSASFLNAGTTDAELSTAP